MLFSFSSCQLASFPADFAWNAAGGVIAFVLKLGLFSAVSRAGRGWLRCAGGRNPGWNCAINNYCGCGGCWQIGLLFSASWEGEGFGLFRWLEINQRWQSNEYRQISDDCHIHTLYWWCVARKMRRHAHFLAPANAACWICHSICFQGPLSLELFAQAVQQFNSIGKIKVTWRMIKLQGLLK